VEIQNQISQHKIKRYNQDHNHRYTILQLPLQQFVFRVSSSQTDPQRIRFSAQHLVTGLLGLIAQVIHFIYNEIYLNFEMENSKLIEMHANFLQ